MERKNRAVFLDRDGTIIRERNYLKRSKDVVFFKSTVPALKLLQDHGFKLIITSNQSGVARGYFTEGKLKKINERIVKKLKTGGIRITDIFYCPHLPEADCPCRKPKIKMLLAARKKHKLDLTRSFVIGDKLTDVQFAKNAGAGSVMLLTGHGLSEVRSSGLKGRDGKLKAGAPDYIAKNLLDASKWIIVEKL